MTAASDLDRLFPGDGELAALMRRKDWAATSLGPVEGWPTALRSAVRIMLTSRFSMWMGWGDDLAFLYNDAYRRDTLGAKHPGSLGAPTREVWREIWGDIGPRLATVLSGQATWDEGLRLMLERNGYAEETYHTFSYSPLHDDDGHVRGVLCVVIEETARVISERRVELLGRLAAEIASVRTDGDVLEGLIRSLAAERRDLPFTLTYLLDAGGDVAVRAARTGFAAEHPGAPRSIALASDDGWPLRDVLERGRPREVELTGGDWPTGPWAVAPSRAVLVPLAQGQGPAAGVLVAGLNPHRVFDASYREFVALFAGQLAGGLAGARAYERERQRAEDLAALDRAKTAFFSNVSHEFRTPLTLMLGPLDDVLGDPERGPPVRDELATVHRNALRMLKLVNTMLDFSRIEAGRAVAQFHPIDLAQLTTDLASVFRAATEKAGLRLVVDCPPLDAPVLVDRDMWEQIVLNLVSNAFKFTLEGEIAVTLTRRGDRVELIVRDSGSGIPAAELGHVFERFHRVETTRRRTHEGTGIGLALVQELVRLHAGTITVASAEGQGTTFTVSIPIGQAAAAAGARPAAAVTRVPVAFAEEAMRWLPDAPTSPAPTPVATSRAHVLVADDNADMRDYLRRLVGSRWSVETVANGRDALAAMQRRRPDLVITDVMMPELDGFGLLAAIRGDADLRDLPVIVLSARAGEDARMEGLQRGASDYLVKPFVARELFAHVDRLLVQAAVHSAEQAQARRFAAIFEQAPVAIAILRGPRHVFESANPPYRRLVADRDPVGRGVAEALPEVVAQGMVARLDRVYQTGEPFVGKSIPIALAAPDGGPLREHVFDCIYQPLLDRDGAITGVAVVCHDVTDLALARRDAERANQSKDEFLAMLGHELRNPLAPILTALDLMRLRDLQGAEHERAVIERQVQHMVGLVDDLLDVSRIARGKVELRAEPIELADVVARAVEVVSPLLEQQGHALDLAVPPGLFVHGDAQRLAQVFANLLNNAAKYTPRGGRVALRADADAGRITIRVTDDGIGIDAAMLPRIFDMFAQAKQAIDRAQGGLGLGLTIVDNLVRLHGGTVSAHSDGHGRGSELTVVLPAIAAPAVATPLPVAAPARATAAARILVVDDNVDAAEVLADLLERAGYEALAAFDGPSALKAAAQFRPAIAILDIGLPVMDGFELARHLQADPGFATPKMIALTGYGLPHHLAETAAAGFSTHLVKPVDVQRLREVIKALLADPAA